MASFSMGLCSPDGVAPLIVPISETRKIEYLSPNVGAIDAKLSEEDLRENDPSIARLEVEGWQNEPRADEGRSYGGVLNLGIEDAVRKNHMTVRRAKAPVRESLSRSDPENSNAKCRAFAYCRSDRHAAT